MTDPAPLTAPEWAELRRLLERAAVDCERDPRILHQLAVALRAARSRLKITERGEVALDTMPSFAVFKLLAALGEAIAWKDSDAT